MEGTILTPNELWKNFEITEEVTAEVINETTEDGIKFLELYINAGNIDKQVKVYGTLVRGEDVKEGPAIFVVEDFVDGFNRELVTDLARRGYTVLSIDIGGKRENKEKYTIYPESLPYADYENVKDNFLSVEGDAKSTCWYVWTSSARYALEYLRHVDGVKKIGTFGIGYSATVLWHIAGMDKVNCSVFGLNAGWLRYQGIEKFGGMTEPQFSDSMYKFIAGIEPEAYATHITTPTLMLCATNSKDFDCDRVADTISRIDENVYKAIHYSVGNRYRVSHEAYEDALMFYNEILVEDRTGKSLSHDIEIKCDIIDGKAVFEVNCRKSDIEEVNVNVSEQITNSAERYWQKLSIYEESRNRLIFKYSPYSEAGIIVAFATVRTKDGFVSGSNIIAKKFTSDEVNIRFRKNIIYSSREKNSDSKFSIYSDDGRYGQIIVKEEKQVYTKKGPMGIDGVSSGQGLITFCLSSNKFQPKEDSILMMDVYMKEQGDFTIKLITNVDGKSTDYTSTMNILGGDVWHNIKVEKNKFKTAEGMPLKSYDNVVALAFICNGEYLINNIIWI